MLDLFAASRKRNLGLCRGHRGHNHGAMMDASEWKGPVGQSWAKLHALTDRSFSGLTQQLLDRISAFAGNSVLDIGCGAGELSLAIARARPQARVVGLDISDDLVAAARLRGEQHSNAEFALGDAARWNREGFVPDLLVSRHGVMFFDDPFGAFAHLHDLAAPGAHLVFSCFRSPRENPWAADIARMIDQPAGDPLAPGPFAFADPQRIEAVLAAGGWQDVDIAPVDFAYIAGHGADPVADARAFFARIGPAARALRLLEGEARAAFEAKLEPWLAQHRSGDLVVFAAAAWIVTARSDRRVRER